MGKKLVAYYEIASSIGGPRAKIDLVKYTCLSVSQAESVPDTDELVQKYKDAIEQIVEKYKK